MPSSIATCLLVGAILTAGTSLAAALVIVGGAMVFEIILAYGAP